MEEQTEYIGYIIALLIISLASIVSTAIVMLAFIKYKSLRVIEFRFIFYICFADLIFTLIVFFGCVV